MRFATTFLFSVVFCCVLGLSAGFRCEQVTDCDRCGAASADCFWCFLVDDASSDSNQVDTSSSSSTSSSGGLCLNSSSSQAAFCGLIPGTAKAVNGCPVPSGCALHDDCASCASDPACGFCKVSDTAKKCFGSSNSVGKSFCVGQGFEYAGDGDCASCTTIGEAGCSSTSSGTGMSTTSTAASSSSFSSFTNDMTSSSSGSGSPTPASTAASSNRTVHPMSTVTLVFIVLGLLVLVFGCVYLAVQRRRDRGSRMASVIDGDYSLLNDDEDDDDLGL